MTVRRPLTLVDRNNFREMTNRAALGSGADMYKIHQRIAHLYAQNPSVVLSIVSSGGNISNALTDTRLKSGPAAQGTGNNDANDDGGAEYPSATAPVTVTGTTYDKVSETVTTVSTPTYSLKPVRADGTSGVIEMTQDDVIDTFIDPVIDLIVSGTTDVRAAGTYYISTSTSISNHQNLGTVFIDTVANPSAFSNTSIGVAGSFQDPTPISTTYSLFLNQGVSVTCPLPLIVDGTSGLREMTTSEFDTYFTALMRAATSQITGHTLRYNFDGSGTSKGTLIVNQILNSATTGTRKIEGANDDLDVYRSQQFPAGSLVTSGSTQLKVVRA